MRLGPWRARAWLKAPAHHAAGSAVLLGPLGADVKLLALAMLLAGCVTAPPPPPKPELDPAQVYALITHVLSDACTKRLTDEFLIEHTAFLLKTCRGPIQICLRKVCIKLSNEDDEEEPLTP
jgi:hypothetical protein